MVQSHTGHQESKGLIIKYFPDDRQSWDSTEKPTSPTATVADDNYHTAFTVLANPIQVLQKCKEQLKRQITV